MVVGKRFLVDSIHQYAKIERKKDRKERTNERIKINSFMTTLHLKTGNDPTNAKHVIVAYIG